MNGIDVSKYQGDINWKKVKAAGIDFVFVRVGWAGYLGDITEGKDPYFEKNMEGAIAAGLNVGVYVYSYCKTEDAARTAAKEALKFIKPYKLTMPVAFDIEADKSTPYQGFSKTKNSAICKAFLDEIAANGYYPILYTYKAFITSYLDMNALAAYDLWLAHYTTKSDYAGPYTIWQYSSDGTVDGIEGRVDVNVAYVDYPAKIAGPAYGDAVADIPVKMECVATGADQKAILKVLDELTIPYTVTGTVIATDVAVSVGDQKRLTGVTDPLGIHWSIQQEETPPKGETGDIGDDPGPVEDTKEPDEERYFTTAEVLEAFRRNEAAVETLTGVIQAMGLQINKLDAQMQAFVKAFKKINALKS